MRRVPAKNNSLKLHAWQAVGLGLGLVAASAVFIPELSPVLFSKPKELQAFEPEAGSPRWDEEFYHRDTPVLPRDKQVELTCFKYWKTVRSKVTAYTPGVESCGWSADGITSTGKNAWQIDGVAVDPTAIPYGSMVYIPEIGYREVDDTGREMRRSWKSDGLIHIDLRFAEVKTALKWGVRDLNVDIYLPIPVPQAK